MIKIKYAPEKLEVININDTEAILVCREDLIGDFTIETDGLIQLKHGVYKVVDTKLNNGLLIINTEMVSTEATRVMVSQELELKIIKALKYSFNN